MSSQFWQLPSSEVNAKVKSPQQQVQNVMTNNSIHPQLSESTIENLSKQIDETIILPATSNKIIVTDDVDVEICKPCLVIPRQPKYYHINGENLDEKLAKELLTEYQKKKATNISKNISNPEQKQFTKIDDKNEDVDEVNQQQYESLDQSIQKFRTEMKEEQQRKEVKEQEDQKSKDAKNHYDNEHKSDPEQIEDIKHNKHETLEESQFIQQEESQLSKLWTFLEDKDALEEHLTRARKNGLIYEHKQNLFCEDKDKQIKKNDLIGIKREIQEHKGKKIMIITAFEKYEDKILNEVVRGRPLIMIFQLKDEFDEKPEAVLLHQFLNDQNLHHQNNNVSNIYTQNGSNIYYITFDKQNKENKTKATLRQFNLETLEKCDVVAIDIKQDDPEHHYQGFCAIFSNIIYDLKFINIESKKNMDDRSHKNIKNQQKTIGKDDYKNKFDSILEQEFFERTFVEIRYENSKTKIISREIRRLLPSKINHVLFKSEVKDKNQYVEYISDKNNLYIQREKVGLLDWNSSYVTKQLILINQEKEEILNTPKKIEVYSEQIRRQFLELKKWRAMSGIILCDSNDLNDVNEFVNAYSFQPGHLNKIAKSLGIQLNIDILLFFHVKSELLEVQYFSDYTFYENKYFLGRIQEKFDINSLDFYSVAAYYEAGMQLSEDNDNIFIKQDQDDKEYKLSVIDIVDHQTNKFHFQQIVLNQSIIQDFEKMIPFEQFGDRIEGQNVFGVALELSRVNTIFQISCEGDSKQGLQLIIAQYTDFRKQVLNLNIQKLFNIDLLDMLQVCWGSNKYYTDDNPLQVNQNIHWCQIAENKLVCTILVFKLSWFIEDEQYSETKKSYNYDKIGGRTTLQLIGKKMVLFKNQYTALRNTYCPMYDHNQQITGTQWLPEQGIQENGLFLQLPRKEKKFKTDLCNSGFKRIYQKDQIEEDTPFVDIIEASLSKMMLKQQTFQTNGDFNDIEIQIILDRQIRTMLNMFTIDPKHRPFHLGLIVDINEKIEYSLQIKQELQETCDFYQPLESLKGQCLADFFIYNPTEFIKQYKINNTRIENQKKRKEPVIKSLIEVFMKGMNEDDREILKVYLNKKNLLRYPLQITYDLFGQTPLSRAMLKPNYQDGQSQDNFKDEDEIYKDQILTAAFIVKKMYNNSEKITENEQFIIRELLPTFLECHDEPFPFESISQYFNYFGEESKEQELNPGFAIHNTSKDFDAYLDQSSQIIQLKNNTLLNDSRYDMFNETCKEFKSQKQSKTNSKIWQFLKLIYYGSNKRYHVKYLMIDRYTTKLYKKIQLMREQKEEQKSVMNAQIMPMNTLMKEINNKFANNIQNHIVLQKIMDAYFVQTQKFMLSIGAINFMFMTIPFILQLLYFRKEEIFEDSNVQRNGVIICNILCIIVATINLIFEIFQYREVNNLRIYFKKSVHNYIDVPLIIFQYYYSIKRIMDPELTVFPQRFQDLQDQMVDIPIKNQAYWSCYNLLLGVQQMIIMFKYLQVIKEFGNIINLSFTVIGKVQYFIAYFLLYVIFMSIIYGTLGLTMDKDDDHPKDGTNYQQIDRFLKLFFFSYRNAVGDVNTPDTTYWMSFRDSQQIKDGNGGWPLFMALLLWFLWLLNNMYMVIILLNFLISIVSKAHDDALQNEDITLYKQKSQLNYEFETIMKILLSKETEKDLFIIAANFEEDDDEEEKNNLEELEKKIFKKFKELDIKRVEDEEKRSDDVKSLMNEMQKITQLLTQKDKKHGQILADSPEQE